MKEYPEVKKKLVTDLKVSEVHFVDQLKLLFSDGTGKEVRDKYRTGKVKIVEYK